MYKQDVTSAQLLSWFAPLDVAERYEKNRGIGSNDIFYNCSSPWFGSHCQYKFEGDIPSSFDKIIYGSFRQRSSQCLNTENSTCYPFLSTCDRGPSPICLDWREICDDKPDCINGEDEQFCDQLESSECSPKEYRCHYGGQCIPLAFLFDGENNLDCLDGSDEGEFVDRILDIEQRKNCMNNPLFECEERRCRDRYSFSCGDGECSPRHLPITFDYHCYNHRTVKLIRTVLDSNMDCQQTLLCLLGLSKQWTNHCSPPSIIHYPVNRCHSLASQCHSEWITIPQQPILFGFFQFIYLTNRSIDEFEMNILPDYICFDSHRCPGLLQFIVVRNLTNGLSCCHRNDLPDEIGNATVTNFYMIEFVFEPLIQRCLTIGREDFCSDSSLFYCSQSMKCISYHRLVDGMRDCFFGEDESYDACSLNDSSRFVCQYDRSTCLAFIAFSNGVIDCVDAEDELLNPYLLPSKFDYIYSLFCDGFIDRLIINDSLVDETNCEYWPCNTPYVRCDNVWQCLNGMDELNCPDSRWPANQHACSLKNSSDFVCLPIEYLYDTVFNDCPSYPETLWRRIYFNNQTKMNINESLAWHNNRCITREKLCRSNSVQSEETFEIGCPYVDKSLLQIEENIATYHGEYVCHEFPVGQYQNSRHYLLSSRLGFFPPPSAIPPITTIVTNDSQVSNNYTIDIELNYHCYRGIFLRFGPSEGKKCFCPPSSFGDQCQWQSQRVSLTLQFIFRSVKFGINVFQIILMLIDENGRIAPNIEQLTFIPVHDCGIKYNLYLLYPDRPKNSSKNYSVHIDVFDRLTLNYHVSWHLSIPYSFLPVNRLAAQLIIPDQAETEDCQLDCGHHGRCRRYANKRTLLFCLCDPGYSGLACNETHRCSCVIGARCHAPSFCLCPLHRFGRHCFLEHTICKLNNPCENNGFCVPADVRLDFHGFICFCKEGFTGLRCEKINNQITLQFEQHFLATVSSVAIHLITAFNDRKHEHITLFKKIPIDKDTITLHLTDPFHILLVELFNRTYYLTILREIFIPSESIHAEIKSNQSCPSIEELGNATWINSPVWHRLKYYPLLCRQQRRLMCFYDDIFICICDLDRFANCFNFNHSITYNCQDSNVCENNGQCLINNATCPTITFCICPDCFYGTKCQFSTRGFVLSLDSILGYHIRPNVDLSQQSFSIKVAISINTSILIIGIISCSLSMMTFRMRKPRNCGCGWYLLASSIISLCAILLLTIKFWYLVLSQMALIQNRILLNILCIVTDPSLRILLASSDWLSACVAIERLVTVKQGTLFDRKKSQKIAKQMIFIIVFLTISTHLHDPILRRLVDDFDADEQRTWCFIQYSAFLDRWNSTITFLHFLVPFSSNLIGVIFMIISIARSRSQSQPKKTIREHFRHQVHKHKHLLMTPALLVLLSVPRLIIPFFTKCMKTPREPSLLLIGYFVSFVPATLPFFIFVLPSNEYKRNFRKAIQLFKRRFRCAP